MKYNQMATTCGIVCFIAYLFTIGIRYLYQGGKIQQIEWDMATITAGDYTAELKIDADGYRRWYDSVYRETNGDYEKDVAPALSLRTYLAKEIEEILTQDLNRSPLADATKSQVGRERVKGSGKPMDRVSIADIVFSFNNSALINALKTRGGHIANQNFDKMRA